MNRRGKLGLRFSVFAKLSAILILTGILVNALIIFGMRYFSLPGTDARETIDRNIEFYLRTLAQEVGDPPSLERMQEVRNRTGLEVRAYTKDGQALTTNDALPGISQENLNNYDFFRTPARPGFGERPYGIVPLGNTVVALYAPENTILSGNTRVIMAVIVLVSFAFFVGNLAARRVLKPFNALSIGVKAVTEGRFDVLMEEKGDDEFRVVARGFNAMTRRIVQMIKAKQQLLLDVSHELRSPISRMMMTVGMMPKGEDRERLERNLKEMESMISGVLEMSRLEAEGRRLSLAPVDLGKAVVRAASLYDPRSAQLSLSLPHDPVVVKADEQQVQVLLRNLIENAVKYSDASAKPIEILVSQQAFGGVIEVKDRGIGIPKEDLPNVTEPFYRVDRSRTKATGGFGLGLSLCQRIMKSHGGTLEIRSPGLGLGTTASASFPLNS